LDGWAQRDDQLQRQSEDFFVSRQLRYAEQAISDLLNKATVLVECSGVTLSKYPKLGNETIHRPA
jgi:hypothetical protein